MTSVDGPYYTYKTPPKLAASQTFDVLPYVVRKRMSENTRVSTGHSRRLCSLHYICRTLPRVCMLFNTEAILYRTIHIQLHRTMYLWQRVHNRAFRWGNYWWRSQQRPAAGYRWYRRCNPVGHVLRLFGIREAALGRGTNSVSYTSNPPIRSPTLLTVYPSPRNEVYICVQHCMWYIRSYTDHTFASLQSGNAVIIYNALAPLKCKDCKDGGDKERKREDSIVLEMHRMFIKEIGGIYLKLNQVCAALSSKLDEIR